MDPGTAMLLSALISGGTSLFSSMFSGKKDKLKKGIPTKLPEQLQGIRDYMSGSTPESKYFSDLMSGSPEAFKAFEAPYLQQYQNEVIPMISERFAGQGTGAGALNSSAFQNTLAESAKRLQTNLAGMKSNLGMQAASTMYSGKLGAMGISPFENIYMQGTQGGQGAGNLMSSLLPLAFMNIGGGGGGGGASNPYAGAATPYQASRIWG